MARSFNKMTSSSEPRKRVHLTNIFETISEPLNKKIKYDYDSEINDLRQQFQISHISDLSSNFEPKPQSNPSHSYGHNNHGELIHQLLLKINELDQHLNIIKEYNIKQTKQLYRLKERNLCNETAIAILKDKVSILEMENSDLKESMISGT